MPRRKNDRPTTIYWLLDIRPETLIQCPSGWPFYCGKSVTSLTRRLGAHWLEAERARDKRPVYAAMRALGRGLVGIRAMELVSVEGDWIAREQRWIENLFRINPNAANVAKGGAGVPGLIHSAETRAKISAAGFRMSAETRAKMSAAGKGRKQSPEHVAKRTAGNKGRTASPETRAKMSDFQRNRKPPVSIETRAKLAATSRGRKQSPEQIEKSAAKRRGQTYRPETIERMRLAAIARVARGGPRLSNGQFASVP